MPRMSVHQKLSLDALDIAILTVLFGLGAGYLLYKKWTDNKLSGDSEIASSIPKVGLVPSNISTASSSARLKSFLELTVIDVRACTIVRLIVRAEEEHLRILGLPNGNCRRYCESSGC